MASQNSCTPLGTPDDVTLARKKNASAITMAAAIAVDSTVSRLTLMPNHLTVSCWPTSIAASARVCSVMLCPRPFGRLAARTVAGHRPCPGAQLLPHRQRRRQHQQHLEQRQTEDHAQPGGP